MLVPGHSAFCLSVVGKVYLAWQVHAALGIGVSLQEGEPGGDNQGVVFKDFKGLNDLL